MRRTLAILALVVLACVLGAVQIVATIALRHDAAPSAWVGLVPPAVGRAVDDLDPTLPLPPALRLVLARGALARGDDTLVAAHLARMAPSRDREALAGALAERRGDVAEAIRDELAAGDLPALERRVDALATRGDRAGALALQHALIDRLAGDRTEQDALAEAEFRLGRLDQALAYRLPIALRGPDQAASAEAYRRAVELAPLSGRFLLGAASQELNVGDLSAAGALYARAHAIDPTNPDAVAGEGETARRRGDLVGARAALAAAERLGADSPAVRRLRAALGS